MAWRAGPQRSPAVSDRARQSRASAEPRRWERRSLLSCATGSHELGAVTHTRLRHRPHHLSPVRRLVAHPRRHCGSCGDHQAVEPPGLAHPRPTTRPGPPCRVPINRLIPPPDSGSVPGADRSPLPIAHPTPQNEAPDWPDPRNMGRSDSTHKMNARMSDSNVRGLNPQRGLWYFPVQPKRPFKIPISRADPASTPIAWSGVPWDRSDAATPERSLLRTGASGVENAPTTVRMATSTCIHSRKKPKISYPARPLWWTRQRRRCAICARRWMDSLVASTSVHTTLLTGCRNARFLIKAPRTGLVVGAKARSKSHLHFSAAR